ncbi:histone H1.1, embryonic-like [Ostrinia furnacalis]|uniref:histone H1.1, embryonic-like n=1 Tax=Ostrinia furnacalis TaxID=93504 RepID=UPI00103D9260|nr:histone H1.1, embryonic-like [Ostrinia furnacalis]
MSSASGSESSESESDIELQSALPALAKKTTQKPPKSPSEGLLKKSQDPKKKTTKDMIIEALTEQKTRKGISLHAIRKFIMENHTVNQDRITFLIKKNLKMGVEDGTIMQTKGIGASGSFKLAPKKKEEGAVKKKAMKPKPKPKPSEETEKPKKTKEKPEKNEKKEKIDKKSPKKKVEAKPKKEKPAKEKAEKKEVKEKKTKSKMAKEMQTPAKKRAAMMKRKSIGSIIKPPKMKPKSKS